MEVGKQFLRSIFVKFAFKKNTFYYIYLRNCTEFSCNHIQGYLHSTATPYPIDFVSPPPLPAGTKIT